MFWSFYLLVGLLVFGGTCRAEEMGSKKLEHACKQKNALSCWQLGVIKDVAHHPKEAIALYERACLLGEKEACAGPGMVEAELGHLDRSRILLDGACKKKSATACMYLSDIKMTKDAEKRKEYLDDARRIAKRDCKRKDSKGCRLVAVLSDYDHPQVRGRLTKACQKGNLRSCSELGELEIKVGNTAKAHADLELACKKDYMKACFELAKLEKDNAHEDHAKKICQMACENNEPLCCEFVAEEKIHHHEIAEARDLYARAKPLYQKRCRTGDRSACRKATNCDLTLTYLRHRLKRIPASESRNESRNKSLSGNSTLD